MENMEVEKKRRFALKQDRNKDDIHLQLGLIEMQQARDAVRDKLSAYTVGRHLISGVRELCQARHTNEYIKGFLNPKDWGDLLTNNRYCDFDLSPEFLDSAPLYEKARAAMVEAQYEDVLELVRQIKKPPHWMNGHLRLLRGAARLRSAEDRNEALEILKELEAIREEVPEETWAPIFGSGAAQWAKDDPHWKSKALEALNRSIELAVEIEPYLAAKALLAYGLIKLGESQKAKNHLDEIEKTIIEEKSRETNLDLREIGLGLAKAYTELSNFKKVSEWLEQITKADPIYFKTIRNSSSLKSFRVKWTPFENWWLKHMHHYPKKEVTCNAERFCKFFDKSQVYLCTSDFQPLEDFNNKERREKYVACLS